MRFEKNDLVNVLLVDLSPGIDAGFISHNKINSSHVVVFSNRAELLIDPALPIEEVQHYSLPVVSIVDTDITKFKPFHSVVVRRGQQTGRAQVRFQADPLVSGSNVTVSGISFSD